MIKILAININIGIVNKRRFLYLRFLWFFGIRLRLIGSSNLYLAVIMLLIKYIKHIDQRHSEVGVNILGNLPVQLFLDNLYMHIVNSDVDQAVVEAFSSYRQ